MSDLRAMQRLCGLMRKAVQDYEMIVPGDRVMILTDLKIVDRVGKQGNSYLYEVCEV